MKPSIPVSTIFKKGFQACYSYRLTRTSRDACSFHPIFSHKTQVFHSSEIKSDQYGILKNQNSSLPRNHVRHNSVASTEYYFPGAIGAPYTEKLQIVTGEKQGRIPCFRIMNEKGEIHPSVEKEYHPDYQLETSFMVSLYECMLKLHVMDTMLYSAQRQGRISFYMTSFGEEATSIGSAAALDTQDVIFGQYREQGVLLWRGFSFEDFCNQCCSNLYDSAKGRQMPVHYGSRKLNFLTISSPLATQIPQASGYAYGMKLSNAKHITVCYFGEGAASEGDFHAALNFAATLECPILFICRNNGYAISTPAKEQYRGDGIAGRGLAYGIDSMRVDGNDLWSVYFSVKEAKKRIQTTFRPFLLELLTYRGGHHSTSDDSSRYRQRQEIDMYSEHLSPLHRMKKFLEFRKLWTEEMEESFIEEQRKQLLKALEDAESAPKAPLEDLFTDVYDQLTPNLEEQKASLFAFLDRQQKK
eukprot:jgi/Galph1/516/GphlegSOOS_G5155.1